MKYLLKAKKTGEGEGGLLKKRNVGLMLVVLVEVSYFQIGWVAIIKVLLFKLVVNCNYISN